MLELWQALPEDFRLPDPEAEVTVWRGDKIGKSATGMACRLQFEDPDQVVIDVANAGSEALETLIDGHTSADPNSPLISVATDIRLAQFYAGYRDEDETIYEITMPAHRFLRDPKDRATPRWPQNAELFVVGGIHPDEITKFKTNNNDRDASELLFEIGNRRYVATHEIDMRDVPIPESPNTMGVWLPA
jgi:hypothetical protein